MEFQITDNNVEGKISACIDNAEAGYIKFKWVENNDINPFSTLVFDEYRDKRLGMPLFDRLVEYIIEKKVKVYPTCPFVVKMFSRKPELKHLISENFIFPEL